MKPYGCGALPVGSFSIASQISSKEKGRSRAERSKQRGSIAGRSREKSALLVSAQHRGKVVKGRAQARALLRPVCHRQERRGSGSSCNGSQELGHQVNKTNGFVAEDLCSIRLLWEQHD